VAGIESWLDHGDKLGSIVGALTAVMTFFIDRRSRAAKRPQAVRHRAGLATVFALTLLAVGLLLVPDLPVALRAAAMWTLPAWGVVALIIVLRPQPAARLANRGRPPELDQLLILQQAEVFHRYKFIGFHAPALSAMLRDALSRAALQSSGRLEVDLGRAAFFARGNCRAGRGEGFDRRTGRLLNATRTVHRLLRVLGFNFDV
jgi:hypothetical protein